MHLPPNAKYFPLPMGKLNHNLPCPDVDCLDHLLGHNLPSNDDATVLVLPMLRWCVWERLVSTHGREAQPMLQHAGMKSDRHTLFAL